MNKTDNIPELKSIIEEQLSLLNLCFYLTVHEGAVFEGEILKCTLEPNINKVSTMMALAGGQSVSTILKLSEWKGIPGRDMFPIARCALESLINAAFIMCSGAEAADRAIRHVSYGYYKLFNKKIGVGDYEVIFKTDPEENLNELFPDFDGKGNNSWTKRNVMDRILMIDKVVGAKSGSRFFGGYILIYSVSSEIIHGSLFGVDYFFRGVNGRGKKDINEFTSQIESHIEEIYYTIIHALAGYLSTFFRFQDMKSMVIKEQEIFNRFLVLAGVDPQ